jgi:hypothetical protein
LGIERVEGEIEVMLSRKQGAWQCARDSRMGRSARRYMTLKTIAPMSARRALG